MVYGFRNAGAMVIAGYQPVIDIIIKRNERFSLATATFPFPPIYRSFLVGGLGVRHEGRLWCHEGTVLGELLGLAEGLFGGQVLACRTPRVLAGDADKLAVHIDQFFFAHAVVKAVELHTATSIVGAVGATSHARCF